MTEATTGTKPEAKKTESGYAVRLVGFVPVGKTDLDGHERALAAINAARRGNTEPLMKMLRVDEVSSQTVARRPVAEPAKPAAPSGADGTFTMQEAVTAAIKERGPLVGTERKEAGDGGE